MGTIKDGIILAIGTSIVGRPRDIQAGLTDEHNLIHVLYSLNRQGMVAFRLRKRGTTQEPTRLHLTKRGLERLRELQP